MVYPTYNSIYDCEVMYHKYGMAGQLWSMN